MASGKRKYSSRRASMRRKRKMRALLVLGTAAFLLVFGGSWFALRSYVEQVDGDVICDNISIGGLDVSGMTKKEAVQALKSRVKEDRSRTVTLRFGDEKVEVFLKQFGYDSPDIKELVAEAADYGKKGSMWMRYRQMKKLEDDPLELDEEYTVSAKKVKKLLKEQADPLLKTPENAYLDRDDDGSVSIVAEKKGKAIDSGKAAAKLTARLNDGWDHEDFTLKLKAEMAEPEICKADLKGLTDELGSYTTDAGGGERWTNLKTGAAKLNGTLLQPGQELSVYDATAPYDEENGYVEGTAYENGQVVPSYGGGICQVSTTLYNAAIYAELEIVERHPHSMTVDYVEPSRDAAIAGGSLDFRFKNPYDTPIYIFGEIDGSNQLRMVIYGKETRDKKRTIEFESETLSTESYSVVWQTTSSLSFGEMQYSGSPHTGVEAQLWKVIYKNGQEVSREVFNTSSYQKSDQIILVGLAGGSSSAISALESAVASQDSDAIYQAIAAGAGGQDASDSYDYDEEATENTGTGGDAEADATDGEETDGT